MVYHAGLNDTREAIEQIDRLARALPQIQPRQTMISVCTVSPGVSGVAAGGCDNHVKIWVDRKAGTGQHTARMVQNTSFPEGWPGQSDAMLALAIFALVVWQVFGEGAEVRRRQDYLHPTSGERDGGAARVVGRGRDLDDDGARIIDVRRGASFWLLGRRWLSRAHHTCRREQRCAECDGLCE